VCISNIRRADAAELAPPATGLNRVPRLTDIVLAAALLAAVPATDAVARLLIAAAADDFLTQPQWTAADLPFFC
jgi:hypothetical protein